jgi:hypothetical protein
LTTQAWSVARQEAVAIEQRVVFCDGLDGRGRQRPFRGRGRGRGAGAEPAVVDGDHDQEDAQLRPVASSPDATVPNVPGTPLGRWHRQGGTP